MEEARQYPAVTPKNLLIDIGFAALAALSVYQIIRMLIRDEVLVRDGWWKRDWKQANYNRWMYAYKLVSHVLMIGLAAFFIYADFRGWTR